MACLMLHLAVMTVLFGQALTSTTTTSTPPATVPSATAPNFTASVPENSTAGTIVFNITTMTPNNLTMQSPDTDPKKFMLDGMLLKLAGSLNFENISMYNVTVEGTNPANETATVTITITIMITDVNEAPEFSDMTYSATVPDGTTAGTFVLNTAATDPEMDTITYAIMDDTDDDFEIDNMGTITVAANKTLTQQRKCRYALMVNATDNATTPLTGTANVAITVGTCQENSGVRVAGSFLCIIATLLYAVL